VLLAALLAVCISIDNPETHADRLGLALTAVSDGKVSSALGCVIIALGSSVINFCGLKAILYYEKYAWLVFFIVFMVMYGMAAPHAVLNVPTTEDHPALHGANLAGNVLSLLSVVYGSSCSWATIAADYYVHYPINTSKVKVFTLCTLGISIPTCIGMILGCCIGSTLQVNEDWINADKEGLGYLIQKILFPQAFAKFILVLLVLSAVGMNALNLYSCALSIQQFARPFAKVPRTLWVLVVFGVVTAIAVAGRDHLLDYLENFLSLLGYWVTSFFVIVFIEHYWFRKGDFANYDLDGWNTPSKLPIGLAGLTAFLIGVVGWCLGMYETWFTGPLAKQIGEGGDIANELTFAFTLLTYIPLRHLEYRFFKK
jgi:purine-cytosine permease-like protein